jgi:hypothetical protein
LFFFFLTQGAFHPASGKTHVAHQTKSKKKKTQTKPNQRTMDLCLDSLVHDVAIDVFNAFVDTCRHVLGQGTLNRNNLHALNTPFITSTQNQEHPLHHFREQCLKMRSDGDANVRHIITYLAHHHHCSYRHIEDLWTVIYMQLVRLSYVNPYLFHAFDGTDNCTEGVAACQQAIWFVVARAIQWDQVDQASTPRLTSARLSTGRTGPSSRTTGSTTVTARSNVSQRSSLADHIRDKVAASVTGTERSYEDQPIKLRVNLHA